jgi:hypothetical protein
MSRRRKKKDSRKAEKLPRSQKGSRGAPKSEEEPEAPSKGDRLFWYILPIILLFVASVRFARSVRSPWAEILVVLQFLCPVAVLLILWRAFPHPLKSMNKKLAAERAELRRQQKRKKKRGR